MTSAPDLLRGDTLKQAVFALQRDIEAKIDQRQSKIPTFCDFGVLEFIRILRQFSDQLDWEESIDCLEPEQQAYFGEGIEWLSRLITRSQQGRFISLKQRKNLAPADLRFDREIDYTQLMASQGINDCIQWRGKPLFKTIYDYNIYPMLLWNVRPRTIIELGSGLGISAQWYADLLQLFDIESQVYSVDINRPEISVQGVTFLEGDCRHIAQVLPNKLLAELPHPWLVIEDAHENTFGVLAHLHHHTQTGDYLFVEDSDSKQEALIRFNDVYSADYLLDTYYLDFFGRNTCSAYDSIFVRQ